MQILLAFTLVLLIWSKKIWPQQDTRTVIMYYIACKQYIKGIYNYNINGLKTLMSISHS